MKLNPRNSMWFTQPNGDKAYWSHDDVTAYEAFVDGVEEGRRAAPYRDSEDIAREYFGIT